MKTKREKKVNYRDFYDHFDVQLKKAGSDYQGDCPFCGARKFYVDVDEGQYSCKAGRCGVEGNHYGFIRNFHQMLLNETTEADYKELAREKPGTSWFYLKKAKLAKFDDGEWYFPIYSDKHRIISLRRWERDTNKVISTPKVNAHGFFIARWDDSSDVVYICEGEWDAVAWTRVLGRNKEGGSVISAPGCNTFNEKYYGFFQDKKVVLLYDHDEPKKRLGQVTTPGFDGMAKASKKMMVNGHSPQSIMCLGWEEVTPPMDIRDYSYENFKQPQEVFHSVNEMLLDVESFLQGRGETPVKPSGKAKADIPIVDSFDEVMNEFRKVYQVTPTFEKCVACAFATCISAKLESVSIPLWMFIVGPASSGKTVIVESFSNALEYTYHLSKITSAAMVSGMSLPDGGNASVLEFIKDGKGLFIKDFTAILAFPTSTQEELFGLMRDAYDGAVRVKYGNGQERFYEDIHYTMVGACTDEIYTLNHSSLGERFLKIEILDPAFSPEEQTRAALTNSSTKKDTLEIRLKVAGYLGYLMENYQDPGEPDEEEVEWLINLSQVLAYLRTSVKRKDGVMTYRPRPEAPSRIALQLKKLLLSLQVAVPGRDIEWYMDIVEKVALDSTVGWSLEMIQQVVRREDGITTAEIANNIQVSLPHVRRVMRDLQEIGVAWVGTGPNNSGRGGRNSTLWFPAPDFLKIWKQAGITHKSGQKYLTPSKYTKRKKK